MTVKNKQDEFAEMREEFSRVRGGFDRFAEQFWSDIRDKEQLAAAFREEVAAMESAFEQAIVAFDTYALEFEEDVVAKHDAAADFREEVERTRDVFEATIAEFEAYTENFDQEVDAKRQRVDALQTEIAVTRAAFEEALEEFGEFAEEFDRDVEAKNQEVQRFLESVEDLRIAYEQAREDFSQAVIDFYGYEEESDSGGEDVVEASIAIDEKDTERPETDGDDRLEAESNSEVEAGETGGASAVSDNGPPMIDQHVATEESETDNQNEDAPEDMVECLMCGEYYQAVTESHLQTHDMSMSEYKSEYGSDVALYPGEE